MGKYPLPVRTRRNWRVGAIAAFLVGSIGAFWLPPVSLVLAGLGVFFAWRSNQEDLERARVFAVYRGLVEAGLCFGELKWDGEASWVDGDEDSSRRFANSVRELYGPIQNPTHLVLETDGHVWPVPLRLSEGDLPVEFAHIWARQVGPCEVLEVHTPRGQDLLKKAVEAGGGMEITMSEFGV